MMDTHSETPTAASIGELVDGIAHKVRNPLFAISATLDAFEDEFKDHPQYDEYARLLRSELARLSALTRDLVEYGRPTAPCVSRTSLGKVVEDATKACESLAEEKGVRIECDLGWPLPDLDLDRDQLTRALETLVLCAVQRSPRGADVRIGAHFAERPAGRTLECTVADRGPAVSEADASRLFEPFAARQEGGTGLGLSIAHAIVEGHGGRVEVETGAGGGVVVTLTLPFEGPSPVPGEGRFQP